MTYRIDLKPETQRAVEAAAARQGVSVETFIASAAETQARTGLIMGESVTKAERDKIQRARVQAVRGKFAHLHGTVNDFLAERHTEALQEMQQDSA